MIPLSMLLSSSSEIEEESQALIRKKIRDSSNPLEMDERSFIRLFRLNKSAVICLLEEIKDFLKPRSRSSSIPPILKLAATLRFLASGSYQRSVGQDYSIGMAQSEVSYVLSEVLGIMEERICPKYILWPNENSKTNCKSYFYEKHGFPGVSGCVDGTHINIIRPNRNEHLFYNRKGKHSINVMIVCDHNMKIIAEDCRYGGASHDSFVWSESVARRKLMSSHENGDRNTWLLGDSGYPLEPWVITPYRSSGEGSRESRFNSKHAQARNIIERTIGLLKSRFRCLLAARELHYSPRKASQIINVCCALHNVCLNFNIPLEDIEEAAGIEELEEQNPQSENQTAANQTAASIRNEILNSIIR